MSATGKLPQPPTFVVPREFQLDVAEVEIFRRGDRLVLRKLNCKLTDAFHLLATMPNDFIRARG